MVCAVEWRAVFDIVFSGMDTKNIDGVIDNINLQGGLAKSKAEILNEVVKAEVPANAMQADKIGEVVSELPVRPPLYWDPSWGSGPIETITPEFQSPSPTYKPDEAQIFVDYVEMRYRVKNIQGVFQTNDGKYNAVIRFFAEDKYGNDIGLQSVKANLEQVTHTNLAGYALQGLEMTAVAAGALAEMGVFAGSFVGMLAETMGTLASGGPNIFDGIGKFVESESTKWIITDLEGIP